MEVSATAIRNAIKNKKSLTNLIPPKIQDYIRKFNPY
jgi:nicotinic acid mononucleotide adenylyltransferase